jgi:hypothetical protein
MPQGTQCERCKWRVVLPFCRAFPDGIPEAIMTGKFDHKNMYPGNNGVRFEPTEEYAKEKTRGKAKRRGA